MKLSLRSNEKYEGLKSSDGENSEVGTVEARGWESPVGAADVVLPLSPLLRLVSLPELLFELLKLSEGAEFFRLLVPRLVLSGKTHVMPVP